MKKILLSLVALFVISPCWAIDWVELYTPANKPIALDVDSIKEYNNYYFYNVKMYKKDSEDVVITMQAQKTHPFCARIKYYELAQYEQLNGDYSNITTNMTTKLEPVTFESRAYAAYKKVAQLMRVKPQITF